MAERNPFHELLENLDEDDWEQIEEELLHDDNGPSGPGAPRQGGGNGGPGGGGRWVWWMLIRWLPNGLMTPLGCAIQASCGAGAQGQSRLRRGSPLALRQRVI